MRKQAIAASGLKDQTLYIVPHATRRPVGDINLILKHMLVQVSIIRRLLNSSNEASCQWESLTRRFPELDDIVDRTSERKGLTSVEMRQNLVQLYQTYITEWDNVESYISAELSNQMINLKIS